MTEWEPVIPLTSFSRNTAVADIAIVDLAVVDVTSGHTRPITWVPVTPINPEG